MRVQKWVHLKSISSLILVLIVVSLVQAGGESGLTPRGESTGKIVSPSTSSPATRAPIVMSQSTSEDLVDGTSIACAVLSTKVTRDNSYYRVFKLSDFGVTEPLVVHEVKIGVEASLPGFGSSTQPLTLKLHTLTGDQLTLANLSTIFSATYQIPSISLDNVKLPVNAIFTADQTLVVEIAIPDAFDSNSGNIFYLGSNTQGASGPSYILGPDCGISAPTDISTLDLGGATPPDWVMSVSGETQSGSAYQLLSNGDFEYDINGDKLPEVWSAKRLTADKMKKNKDGEIFAFSGEWAFVFKGGVGEKSQIAHPVDLTGHDTAQNDTLSFSAAVRAKNLTEGAAVKMNVTYTGDEKPLGKIKLVIPPGTYDYQVLTSDVLTLEKSADKVKLIIQSKATAGRFLIDAVELVWEKPAAAIPLPAASGN